MVGGANCFNEAIIIHLLKIRATVLVLNIYCSSLLRFWGIIFVYILLHTELVYMCYVAIGVTFEFQAYKDM